MIGPLIRIESDAIPARFAANGPIDGEADRVAAHPVGLQSEKITPTPGLRALDRLERHNPDDGGGRFLPGLTESGELCRLLSVLADRTRLKILRILAGGERPVLALTSQLGLPQPTVSHHLAALRIMGLVSPRRQGKHVFYDLGPRVSIDGTGNMTFRADNAIVTVAPNPAA